MVRATEPREEAEPSADAAWPAGPEEVLAALREVLHLTRHAVDRTRITKGERQVLRQAWSVSKRS